MTERPILFSGPMVRAILAGKKRQTRRVVHFPPYDPSDEGLDVQVALGNCKCPYGQPGDVLWVKEAWGFHSGGAIVTSEEARPNAWNKAGFGGKGCWSPVVYKAGTEDFAWGMYGPPKWRSPLFMPRSASRLSLVIKSVRVERVQDINECDIVAEGIPFQIDRYVSYEELLDDFRNLWDSINGKKYPWASNPLVWVLEFEV